MFVARRKKNKNKVKQPKLCGKLHFLQCAAFLI